MELHDTCRTSQLITILCKRAPTYNSGYLRSINVSYRSSCTLIQYSNYKLHYPRTVMMLCTRSPNFSYKSVSDYVVSPFLRALVGFRIDRASELSCISM